MLLSKVFRNNRVLHRTATTVVGDLPEELAPPARFIPAGFDAIVQFDDRLLKYQLLENLRIEGLSILSAEVSYDRDLVPNSLSAVIEDQISLRSINVLNRLFIEMRLVRPKLRTIRSQLALPTDVSDASFVTNRMEPPLGAESVSSSRHIVELSWTIELNLLKRAPRVVAEIASGPSANSDAGESVIEERVILARGRSITPARADLVLRPDSLEMWVSLDFSASSALSEAEDPLLQDFLKSQLANVLSSTLMTPLVNTSDICLTPRVALAGKLNTLQIARTRLSGLRVREAILVHPDGREVLSLCINTGEAIGSERLVQPFLGAHNFAYYVSANVFVPVLRERWKAKPALRQFVGDVPVELASSDDSDETQEGRARVRVTISDSVAEINVRASEDEFGDPVRIRSEQEIRLLKLWDHHGDEVTNLGDLAKPVTESFILHALLFDDDVGSENTGEAQEAFKEFIEYVFLPTISPVVEAYKVASFSGYTSSALGAIVTRWSMQEPSFDPIVIAGATNEIMSR